MFTFVNSPSRKKQSSVSDQAEESHRQHEVKIGTLAYELGSTSGRFIATNAQIAFGYRAEDAKVIIPFFVGMISRKFAELEMHKYLCVRRKILE